MPSRAPIASKLGDVHNLSGDLIGTSDARGCGQNFYYDGTGRLIAEDYSPCEAHHAPYVTLDFAPARAWMFSTTSTRYQPRRVPHQQSQQRNIQAALPQVR